MERYCATGQSPQRAVVPMEEEEGRGGVVNNTVYNCKIFLYECQYNNYLLNYISVCVMFLKSVHWPHHSGRRVTIC